MSGDGRPLSVRLHEKARRLESFMPATAPDFHELADEVADLEARPPCACGGGKVLVDRRVVAHQAGGHSGPTYRYTTYEVKLRFPITTPEHLPESLDIRVLVMGKPCS